MNDLTIYLCAHKPFNKELPNYYQVVLNTETLNGTNIFHFDKTYSEGSQIYYIWKNLSLPEYVGTAQYRKIWPEIDMTLLDKYDVILPAPYVFQGCNNYIQYGTVLNTEDLNTVLNITCNLFPEYKQNVLDFCLDNVFYPFNMFIMKRDMFIKYCEFVFAILSEFNKKMNFSNSEDVYNYVVDNIEKYKMQDTNDVDHIISVARTQGHLLERLTNIFIKHNFSNIKTYKVPIVD